MEKEYDVRRSLSQSFPGQNPEKRRGVEKKMEKERTQCETEPCTLFFWPKPWEDEERGDKANSYGAKPGLKLKKELLSKTCRVRVRRHDGFFKQADKRNGQAKWTCRRDKRTRQQCNGSWEDGEQQRLVLKPSSWRLVKCIAVRCIGFKK